MNALGSLLDGFLGSDQTLRSQISRERVLNRTQEYLSTLPAAYRLGIQFGIFYFKCEQVITLRSPQTQLIHWSHSWILPKRMLYQAFKFIFLPKIYTEPLVLESLGYGPTAERRKIGQC